MVFLGLTVRSLFRTREMAIQVLLFTSLPALFLSGFAWPSESLPRWLAAFAKALPSTSAIPGVLRLTQMGAALPDVRAEWMMLWVLCGAFLRGAWVADAPRRARHAVSQRSSTSAIAPAVTGFEM